MLTDLYIYTGNKCSQFSSQKGLTNVILLKVTEGVHILKGQCLGVSSDSNKFSIPLC